MLSSAKGIYRTLQPYLGKGYILCPDTNFLMNASDVFSKLKGETVVVSRHVFNELDNLKKPPPGASRDDHRKAFEAREGMRALDVSQASIIEPAPSAVFKTYNLTNTPDERIIASYLHHREGKQLKVLFLTLDRGAKMVARSAGLETVEFNLEQFSKKRKREKIVLSKYSHKKKLNPIQQFIYGLTMIFSGIITIIKFVIGFGTLAVVFLLFLMSFLQEGYVGTAKSVSLMDGGVVITPTLIAQEKTGDEYFTLYYELKNNQERTVRGFHNPDRPLGGTYSEQKELTREGIYVFFQEGQDANVYAYAPVDEVDQNEKIKGSIRIEGDLSNLKELQTAIYFPDTEERIPYTISIDQVEKVRSSKIEEMAEEAR